MDSIILTGLLAIQQFGIALLICILYDCRPFLLQSKASYTQIGIFSIASYPYSFKLFWSPIVDSVYSLAFGRRKSWVVPIQLGSAGILLTSATWLSKRYAAELLQHCIWLHSAVPKLSVQICYTTRPVGIQLHVSVFALCQRCCDGHA